jgi:outer membrane protein assembly factor BamB
MGTTDGRVVSVNSALRMGGEPFLALDQEWEYKPNIPSKGFSCSSGPAPVSIYGTPAVSDGVVCASIYNGKVYMLNPDTRESGLPFPQLKDGEWSYPRSEDLLAPFVGSPVVEGESVYACCSDGKVYALDKRYGDELWITEELDNKLWIAPVIKDGALYISTFSGKIIGLSIDDGTELPWSYKADAGFVSSPALYQDVIYIGSFDRSLYAIRIGDTSPLWQFPAENWFWSKPVIDNGVLYAGCLDGYVYALNAMTGEEVWSFNTGNPVVAPPLIVDDLLVVANESGDVYFINQLNGSAKRIKNWAEPSNENKTTTGALVRSSLCEYQNKVYVRSQDDVMHAIDISTERVIWQLPLTIEEED